MPTFDSGDWAGKHQSQMSLSPYTLVKGDGVCGFSSTMTVNIDNITSAAAVLSTLFCHSYSADVNIKMLIVFISIEPPTSR